MSDKSNIDISVVIPVFNEQETLPELINQLVPVLNKSNKIYEVIFVNDGSKDDSCELLAKFHNENKSLKVINFARNFGHQLALTAGLRHSQGRSVVVMDSDLQDPPEVILDFIKEWDAGSDVVYGKRKERHGETYFKKLTASLFYKLIQSTTSIDIPDNVGDFYLLDRKVVDVINSLNERHRFLRGLISWIGFKRKAVEYDRQARFLGETKYPFWKMVKFSLDAMTSFSFAPLRAVSFLGGLFSLASFFSILYILYLKMFTDQTVQGWSSLMVVILFLGGIQLLSIGIIGEYVARMGDDVKSRPLYVVSEVLE